MLTIYRRHTQACTAQRSQHDKQFWKCNCTIYAEGKLGSDSIRESLNTRSREEALKRIQEAEASGSWDAVAYKLQTPKVQSAITAFMADASSSKGKNLSPATVSKYRTLFLRCQEFCQQNGIKHLDQLTTEQLRGFKLTWKTGPRATNNNITRVKAFFKFCLENGWISANPALALHPLKHLGETQKLPFTEQEMLKIVNSAEGEVLTFILLLRHTGLRISDAAFLKSDQVRGGMLRVKTLKYGAWVMMPLEPELASRLPVREGFLFLSGPMTLAAGTEFWRRRLKQVFRKAKVDHGHPHRFRHTFAVRLLEQGVDVKTVSLLLGHASVTTTEKFYAAWTDRRQQGLDEELRRTWDKAA